MEGEANDGLKIEEILRRAQKIRRERGGMLEYDFEDWLQAWRELPERDSCCREFRDFNHSSALTAIASMHPLPAKAGGQWMLLQ